MKSIWEVHDCWLWSILVPLRTVAMYQMRPQCTKLPCACQTFLSTQGFSKPICSKGFQVDQATLQFKVQDSAQKMSGLYRF